MTRAWFLLLLLWLPGLAWASPPGACLPDGSLDYYRCRAADFARRQPGVAPPDYYLGYGDVYVRRFTHETRPLLSPAGQRWLDNARALLQQAMESRRRADPAAFARLERDPAAFRVFAFQTHAPAYEVGLDALPLRDLVLVATTPDIQDTLSAPGLAQVLHVLHGLTRACGAQGVHTCAIERLLTEKRELRRLLRDRWGFAPTARLVRFLGRRIADSALRALGITPRAQGLAGALER